MGSAGHSMYAQNNISPRQEGAPGSALVSVRHVTSPEQVAQLRPFWAIAQAHPNADLEQFLLVCRLRPEVISPLVLIAERDGVVCAILAARLERGKARPRIGYLQLPGIPANQVAVLHHGLIGEADKSIAAAFVTRLRGLLESGVADTVTLHQVAESETLLAAALTDSAQWWWEPGLHWATHWSMTLPQDGPDVLFRRLKSKHRSYLRSRLRRIEAANPGEVRWRWLREFGDVPGLCARLERVAAFTYQRALDAGFRDDAEHRARFQIFAQRGVLRVQLLEIGNEIGAFWIGLVFGDTFHSWATGYCSELTEFDAGTLTFAHLLDELVLEGVRVFDFGLGEAHYKARFGDTSWREASPSLYARNPKGFVLRVVASASDLLDGSARRLVASLQVLDKVKTKWRRMLRRAPTSP